MVEAKAVAGKLSTEAPRPTAEHTLPRQSPTLPVLDRPADATRAHRRAHSAPVVLPESRNRCRDAAISASASDRPTQSAPSTLLPGSRSL